MIDTFFKRVKDWFHHTLGLVSDYHKTAEEMVDKVDDLIEDSEFVPESIKDIVDVVEDKIEEAGVLLDIMEEGTKDVLEEKE